MSCAGAGDDRRRQDARPRNLNEGRTNMKDFEMPKERRVWHLVDRENDNRLRQAVWLPEQGRLYVSLFEGTEEIAVSRRYKEGDEARRFIQGLMMSKEWFEAEMTDIFGTPPEPKEKKPVRKAKAIKRTARTKGTKWSGETQSQVVSRAADPENGTSPGMSLSRPYAIEIYGAAHLLKALADRAESPAVKETFRRASLDLEALTR